MNNKLSISGRKISAAAFALFAGLLLTGCDTTSGYATYLENSRSLTTTSTPQGGITGAWEITGVTCQGVSAWRSSEDGTLSIGNSNSGNFVYTPSLGCTISFPITAQIYQSQLTLSQSGPAFMEPYGCYTNPNPTMSTFTGTYALSSAGQQLTISSGNMTDYCGQGTVPGVMTLEQQGSRF